MSDTLIEQQNEPEEWAMVRDFFAKLLMAGGKELVPGADLLFTFAEQYREFKRRNFEESIQKFIKATDVCKEEIDTFLKELDDEQKKWLIASMLENLNKLDSNQKCEIYGYLFKYLALTRDFPKYRRLFRCIQDVFIDDLVTLDQYKNGHLDATGTGQMLANIGLVDEVRYSAGIFSSGKVEREKTEYKLTELGELLLEILISNKWDGIR